MVHGEHNSSKNNGGFALIILGALLLFLAPNIYQDMRELGTMSLMGGIIVGSIGFYLKFFKGRIKKRIKKGSFFRKRDRDMGFFGKKKAEEKIPERNEAEIPERNEAEILKEELEAEVEKLQSGFREKRKEMDDITQKIESVKKEYDETISNIMSVKKEYNQKKMELDIVQREYNETAERNKKAESIKDTKVIEEFNKSKKIHAKIKQEIDELSKEHDELKKQIEQEKSSLHSIRKQQIEVEKELDEANSRLYNAKEELEKRDHFEDTSVLTPSEKEFIAGETDDKKNSAGIIEAASAVVGSLKSKLNTTLKELETVQSLLEKEREEHKATKEELKKIKTPTKSTDKS